MNLIIDIDSRSARLSIHCPKSWMTVSQASSISGTLTQILSQILLHPEDIVSQMQLLSRHDNQLLLKWNGQKLIASQRTLNIAIDEQTHLHSRSEAICAWDGSLSYGELYDTSQRLAAFLRGYGVGRGSKVPICFDKSKFAIISMLAILRCEGCFVPLDPQNPQARLRRLIEKVDANVVLCSRNYKDLLHGMATAIIPVDQEQIDKLPRSISGSTTPAQPSDIAYIIFTSGSTGEPKAVVIQHKAIMSSIEAHGKAVGLSPRTRCLQFSAFVWDISIFEIFTVLCFGGCICVPSEHERLNAREEAINSMRVNWASMTPTICKLIDPAAVPGLENLLLIGEAMTAPIIDAWSKRILINAYGPAEASVMCHLNMPMTPEKSPMCFGFPVGCHAWIVDRHNHNRLMPVGSVGELLLEGDLLSEGYYKDPVKTSEAYITSPSWTLQQPASNVPRRFYKTGDLARYNSDGSYEFAGRKDTQIKFHGQRIELAEIEFNIQRDVTIKSAIVLLPKSGPCTGRLVALLQSESTDGGSLVSAGQSINPLTSQDNPAIPTQIEHYKQELSNRLPEYMIPSIWIVLQVIPTIASGKLDRTRIARWVAEMDSTIFESIQPTSSDAADEHAQPHSASPTEIQLQKVMSAILGVNQDRLSFKRSFVSLGGDSLSAMQVASKCRNVGIAVSVQSVLRCESIIELATLAQPLESTADNKTSLENRTEAPQYSAEKLNAELSREVENRLTKFGLRLADIEEVYPCSALQQGILLGRTRNAEAYAAHATHKIASLDGAKIDVQRLISAWQNVINRHALLRTVFLEGLSQHNSVHSQAVLKRFQPSIIPLKAVDETDAIHKLQHSSTGYDDNGRSPLHSFTVCTTPDGSVFCKLEISHAIMDGSSISIIYEDIAKAYANQLDTLERPLYSEYLAYLANYDTQSALDYWKTYLHGADPCHFPILSDGNTSERVPKAIRIPFDDFEQLQTSCDANRVTINNALQVAWAITLQLYTGAEEVCFGYISSARVLENSNDVVGPYINMLTSRLNLPSNRLLREVLLQAQKDYLEALPYQHISLGEVQDSLKLSETSLFNTLLSYRKLPPIDLTHALIKFDEVVPTFDPDEYNVSINVEAGEKSMAIDFTYWTDCLCDSQAENVAATFKQTLQSIAQDSNRSIGELDDYLGDMQRSKISIWNGDMPESVERCIHDVFHSQAVSRPQAAAIDAWDGKYSYAELDRESSKLAHYLHTIGVTKQTPVLICFSKSAFTILAMLSVLKANGTCVPLDASHPKSALELRANDTGARTALVGPTYVEKMQGVADRVVVINATLLASLPGRVSKPSSVSPSDACFIQYTSGSTGKPKGIILEHRNIVTSAAAHGPLFGINSDSRVLQFASYTFDNSLEEMFTTLMRGGCVCVPSDHDRLNNLGRTMNDLQITFADLTASVASFLNPAEVPTLQRMILGGEAVTNKVLDIWKDSISVCGGYGPSECSVNCSFSADITSQGKTTNIGRPCGCVLWIVDANDHNKLVPIGAPGELLVEGPIVSRGYLNDEEKTSKAFIKDPTWAPSMPVSTRRVQTRRMYKTGDLVRYDFDGTIQYLGRKDNQVKFNGQRIELGEIEYQLEQCLPADSQSAVELVTLGNQPGAKKELAAFICSSKHESIPGVSEGIDGLLKITQEMAILFKSIETTMSSSLPSYMIPTAWLPMEKLPLSSAGKLNRRQLRSVASSLPASDAKEYRLAVKSGRKPEKEMELRLAELWSSVLKIDLSSIGVEDSFFKLGGNSLTAMKLVSAARAKGIPLTVTNIFQKPLLENLATEISNDITSSSAQEVAEDVESFSLVRNLGDVEELRTNIAERLDIDTKSILDIYPCTPMQAGLISISAKTPGAYVAQRIFQLPDDVDVDRFCQAWQIMTQSEPTLRTRIMMIEPYGHLSVVTNDTIEWEYADSPELLPKECRLLPAAEGDRLVNYAITGEGTSRIKFVWTMHHALYDGWCSPLMLEKVKAIYDNKTNGQVPRNPQYSGFIAYLTTIDPKKSDEFWRTSLAGTASAQFPRLPTPSYQANASSVMWKTIEARSSKSSDITIASIIRATWSLVVAAYSGNDEVTFNETLSGRDAPVDGIEEMIGATLTTIPTRVHINRKNTISEFLHNIQIQSVTTKSHQYAGLQRIKQLSNDAALACSAQSLISINHGTHHHEDKLFCEIEDNAMSETNFYTYPLMITCFVDTNSIELEVHYDTNVIADWLMQRILHHFDFILDSLLNDQSGSTQLQQLRAPSSMDIRTIRSWNDKVIPVADDCIHEVIHRYASTTDESRQAVCAWDVSLSYGELDNLSNKLAWRLHELGIGKDDMVPIYANRSGYIIVEMLAVIKTGAAFVLLSPDQPLARLQTIVQDTDANFILCSAQHSGICSSLATKVVVVGKDMLAQLKPRTMLPAMVSSSAIAYIQYTSGSTGKPKGILVSHTAFVSSAKAHGPAMGMSRNSRVLQFASYTFDASLLEILTGLILGACVCVPTEEDRLNNTAEVINKMDVTWTFLTPSFAQTLDPRAIPKLKTLVLGGEAMSTAHITTWSPQLELMNGYGPSETSAIAMVNPNMTLETNPFNIGFPVGCRCWVVDSNDHNRLVPLGCVGELLLDGPILARGYLKNEEKTVAAFINTPSWLKVFGARMGDSRRLYKTGDLVKYGEDGSIIYLGRKDSQVKINGQRVELGEIEYHLAGDEAVLHGMVVLPKSGIFRKKLIAVLSLKALSGSQSSGEDLQLADKATITPHLVALRHRMSAVLPPYMMPAHYLVLQSVPLLPSSKLNRKALSDYVEAANDKLRQQVQDVQTSIDSLGRDATTIEAQLRDFIASVLGIAVKRISYQQSVLSLGMDSIQAMQLKARCRAAGYELKIQDILSSKSIIELADTITTPKAVTVADVEAGKGFALSPIQKLYFDIVGDRWHHFNQSMAYYLKNGLDASRLQMAFDKIIKSHSMLRARFHKTTDGQWSQIISQETQQSYKLLVHRAAMSTEQIVEQIASSQKSLDVTTGPLLAVDLFTTTEGQQNLLSICAHHLVVDVVSWKIITADLETILQKESAEIPPEPISFQEWSQLQYLRAQDADFRNVLEIQDIPAANLTYWGMDDILDRTGDALERTFELDPYTTAQLLGDCNKAMNTEIVDILTASILYAFMKTFPDRLSLPTLYNEGHGREAWDDIDISETVGWFTTLTPLHLPSSAKAEDNLIKCIRWIKDLRRRTPGKGRPYFAYRQLNKDNRFANHWPMEIAFNYLGQTKSVADKDAILLPISESLQTKLQSDIGPDSPRWALFDLQAAIHGSRLRFSFACNKFSARQDKIKQWVSGCQTALTDAASGLSKLSKQATMAFFPSLPLIWNGIDVFQKLLPRIGVSSLDEIEDAYPCSPMQKGMLLSQVKDPLNYSFKLIFKVSPLSAKDSVSSRRGRRDTPISIDRLGQAWIMVVNKHSSLRTVFVDELSGPGTTAQIVLKHHTPRILFQNSRGDAVSDDLAKQPAPDYTELIPPHRLIIAESSSGDVYCRLDMSHSIIDGGSMSVLFQDLALAYTGQLEGSTARYGDYIKYVCSKSQESDMIFWKDYLKDVEPCLFPSLTDGKQRARELQSLDIDIPMSSQISNYCAANEVTISTLLQLTWATVLRKYTGSSDVCFGYLVSERDAPIEGIDNTIGVFINMLTCRFVLLDDVSVSDMLRKVQDNIATGMAHQSIPLADILHALNLGTSMFNTAFSLQKKSSLGEVDSSALSYEFLGGEDPSEFHLTVNIEVSDSNLGISFTYWADTISAAQMTGISSVFKQVFQSIVSTGEGSKRLGEIDCLSTYNIDQLQTWNGKPLPRLEQCVHTLFSQHAQRQPFAPALDAWDGRYTYAELDAITDRLAVYLMNAGLQIGEFVPLCFEKSVFTIIAMLATLKAGLAFVPIAPDVPDSRLEFLLDNVKASMVLCSKSTEAKVTRLAKQAFAISDGSLDQLPRSAGQKLAQVDSHDMAYAIFTSGTTGVPKGTIIEHGAFCTGGTEHAKAMFMRPNSRVLQFASYTFDASVMEILSALIIGACVCVPTDHERMSDIPGVIERMKITWTLLTPSVANILRPESVPSLKTLVTGGEAMSRDHIAKWRGKGIALVNAYGPSECSVVATTHTKVDEMGKELDSDPANIGFSVGSRGWVVNPDNHNELLPTGTIGELLVEGRITARCYLNNEEKTSASFITAPAWSQRADLAEIFQERERMYKTGDLVRCNTDGSFNYIARKDTQIKLNGQRIEVAEIEHHVKENLPENSQAAVDLVAPAESRKVLAIFFSIDSVQSGINRIDEILLTMDSETSSIASTVQNGLKGALPAYMIPSVYIPLRKMPWTASGKLDRGRMKNIVAKLSKEEFASYKLGAGTVSAKQLPQTEMEKKLQSFWSIALDLKLDSIGASDNFFRLGGDSISAMKLVNIAAANQITLATIEVFRNPKLSDMAEVCSIMKSTADNRLEPFVLLPELLPKEEIIEELSSLCHTPEDQIQDAYPCSRLQEGLLALTVKQTGAYVARFAFKLPGSTQLSVFQAAWQKTVDETDILRTRIPHGEMFGFMQVILHAHELQWRVTDSLSKTFEQTLVPEKNGDPLTRYYLVEESNNARYFVLLIHHALYDGWSLPLVLQRVEENYTKLIASSADNELEMAAPYVNFIQFLQETSPEASNDFWMTRLADSSWASHFPSSNRVGEQAVETLKYSYTFAIRKDLNKMGVTLPVILRAAWALLLSAHTSGEDVLFGETLAGRDVPVHRVTDICGPTLTTVPQKIRVDRSLTVQQYLQYVQRLSTDVISYQHAGLQHIKRLGPDANAACDFQNLLVIQAPEDESEDSIFQAEGTEAGANFFTYPLVLECNMKSGEINVEAHFNPAVLVESQIKHMLSQLDLILQQLGVDMLYKHVSDIDMLTSRDLGTIKEWTSINKGSWIVDCLNQNKLAPIGAVGELVLQHVTPELGTDAVDSVSNAAWVLSLGLSADKLYKTGKLARYNADGSVELLGEKINQVKLQGQQVDLSAVEHLIKQRPQINQVVALIPKSGPCSKKLVALVSITSLPDISVSDNATWLIEDDTRLKEAQTRLEKAQLQIVEDVPSFMIPALWIIVERIPTKSASVPDRVLVNEWLEKMDGKTYRQVLDSTNSSSSSEDQGAISILLRRVWSEIFGITTESIHEHDSFLSLGGDSISAMQVMAKCRKDGVAVSLQDVLRSKSIVSLANKIASQAPTLALAGGQKDAVEEFFDLSPIQRIYFEFIDPTGRSQFNQSQLMSVTRKVDPEAVELALRNLVKRHTMLRSRFSKSVDGWTQKITEDVHSSYRFSSSICDSQDMIRDIEFSQRYLNVMKGPLVACNLFEDDETGAQSLFIAVHHLVVDAVSWSPILQDLEGFLTDGAAIQTTVPFSFQAWTKLQANQAENVTTEDIPRLMPIKARPTDLAYWRMERVVNVYGDTETRTFEVGLEQSALVLGAANATLRTEPIDLLISAIAQSFRTTFHDRPVPAVFNESHGREWDGSVDLSSTVGWFTTITPIQVKPKDKDDALQVVRLVKDTRRRIPSNGRPYFAYRSSKSSQSKFSDSLPVEILFNYFGRSAPTGHGNSLLEDLEAPTDDNTQARISDVGMKTARLALFEISAAVTDGKVKFTFMFNQKMHHIERIRDWVQNCHNTLTDLAAQLSNRSPEPTLIDFPLLPIGYEDLPKIMARSLPKAGVTSLEQVEDIYPCSPTQEGILLSQLRNPSSYIFHEINEVIPQDGHAIDTDRLINAWHQVVVRHSILRTLFIDSFYKGGNFEQVVLKSTETGAVLLKERAIDDDEAIRMLRAVKIQDHNYSKLPRLPHQMSAVRTKEGKVFMKIEMTHAVIDGGSSANILRDLALAYEGRLEPQGPRYSDYISFIKKQTPTSSIRHFKNYLAGIESCLFPSLNQTKDRQLNYIVVDFDAYPQLLSICKATNVTMASMLQSAYAILLRKYTKSNDVSFGYLTSGRDAPVPGIHDAVGLFINMLICRVQFDDTTTLSSVFQSVQNDYLEMIPFQYSSLAKVQHELNLDGKTLFNTAVSIQGTASADGAHQRPSMISFEPLAAYDPGEYAVTANIYVKPGDEACLFRYWTNIISDQQAAEMASQMARILHSIIEDSNQFVKDVAIPLQKLKKDVRAQSSVVSFRDEVEEVISKPLPPPSIVQSSASRKSQDSSPARSVSTALTPLTIPGSPQMQSMIKTCVQEILEQMLKSGKFVMNDQDNTATTATSEVRRGSTSSITRRPSTSYAEAAPPMSRTRSERSFADAPTPVEDPEETYQNMKMMKMKDGDDLIKVNKTLKQVTETYPSTSEDYTVRLRLLWSEILNLPGEVIEPDSSFFEAGGDSILAMEMASLARDNGLSLPVAVIFQHPIFSEMAKVIHGLNDVIRVEETTTHVTKEVIIHPTSVESTYQPFSLLKNENVANFLRDHVCPKVNVFRGGILDVLPVTDFQSFCIAGNLMESRFMLNYFYLEGTGNMDLGKLRRSISQIVQQHDIFRTVFIQHKTQFLQVVLRQVDYQLGVYEADDLQDYLLKMRENDIATGQPELGTPFSGFSLIKKKGSLDHRIVIRMSHAQYDGVSFDKILNRFKAAYEGDPPVPVPPYASLVEYAVGGDKEKQYDYWRNLLAGSTMTEVVKRHKVNFNKGLDARPRTMNQMANLPNLSAYNITDATIIKAAWVVVLAQLTSSSDIVFGQLVNGRASPVEGIENIVGPCLNYTPIRVKLDREWTGLDLLRQVQDQHVTSMSYETLGYREIIDKCTNWSKSKDYSTMVHHLNITEHSEWTMGNSPYKVAALGSGNNTEDFEVVSRPRLGGKVEIELSHANDGLITTELARKALNLLCDAVEAFTEPRNKLPNWIGSSEVILAQPEPEVPSVTSILNEIDEQRRAAAKYVVEEAWSTVIPGPFSETSTFFEKGNFVSAAMASLAYQSRGYKIPVETIIDHPSMRHQMGLIAIQQKHEHDAGSRTSTLNNNNVTSPPPATEPEAKVSSGWKQKWGAVKGALKKKPKTAEVNAKS